ncbi:MAG TPA: aldo/keto reductase [Xanthobacteraceae bacterium]|nr:aldo/keto reductase [Xanthobacteraceae bacterium]
MIPRPLGRSGIEIAPLVLGGNVFGWTADEKTSFYILDAFAAEGFTAIDTANAYSRWVPGHQGGESENIIGKWMKARGNRAKLHVFTKVGSDMGQGKKDLSARHIAEAIEASLRRLQTDYIDLYFAHWPDDTVTQEETLEAFSKLVAAGKVRAIGCSNYDEKLLSDALKVSTANGWPRYEVIQNEYNLYSRSKFEGAVRDIVLREGLGSIPYYGLASGFLTGKYRSEADAGKSARGKGAMKYLDAKGKRILAAMDDVAARTGAALSEIALAWLAAQPDVTAPIASATSVQQVESLGRGARLSLSANDLETLTKSGV